MPDRANILHQSQANPFVAKFGKVPVYFAGREDVISEITLMFEEDEETACCLLVGARGTGKTALLTYFSCIAERLGWVSANVSAIPGMLQDIFLQAQASASHLIEPTSKHTLRSIGVAGVGTVEWDTTSKQITNWRSEMVSLLDDINEQGVGLLITVDEVNVSLDEMIELVAVFQHFVREDRKVALLMAGLPYNVEALIKGKSTSFLRRADRFDLGTLADYEVEEAFKLTVEEGGKIINSHALSKAVQEIGGFPFMFQLMGHRAWRISGDKEVITEQDIVEGAKLASEQMEKRVFDASYTELSNADRSFLLAMLEDEKESTRASLMKRLNKPSSHISTYKSRLIQAGLIDETMDGAFRYALPGLREYLRKRV